MNIFIPRGFGNILYGIHHNETSRCSVYDRITPASWLTVNQGLLASVCGPEFKVNV